MSAEKHRFHLPLEMGRFVVFTTVAVVMFLFFTLLLDVVGLVLGGGWNPLLGDWPIFSGTVSAVVYSSKLSVAALLVSLGLIARLVAGPETPGIIAFLEPREASREEGTAEKER
jgi:hypothetical protein